MSNQDSSNSTPQFGTAEYVETTPTDQCQYCNQMISNSYYRVNGAMACQSCADQASREVPKDSHGAFVRALIWGVGAAVLGLILYAAVGIMTGWVFGYVSLAVGWIVAKAMMKGSGGLGGRRYQVTAALLTYAAVSMAAIPMAIAHQMKEPAKTAQVQQQGADAGENTAKTEEEPKMSFGAAIGYLLLIGLASPFLELADPLHGIIGLVILAVGIQIAWRIAAGPPVPVVDGPFANS